VGRYDRTAARLQAIGSDDRPATGGWATLPEDMEAQP
jgi:hypothetical protein